MKMSLRIFESFSEPKPDLSKVSARRAENKAKTLFSVFIPSRSLTWAQPKGARRAENEEEPQEICCGFSDTLQEKPASGIQKSTRRLEISAVLAENSASTADFPASAGGKLCVASIKIQSARSFLERGRRFAFYPSALRASPLHQGRSAIRNIYQRITRD